MRFTRRAFNLMVPALFAAGPATTITTRPAPRNKTRPIPPPFMLGVNLCGAEFGEQHLPGEYGKHYIYPAAKDLDYYHSKGLHLVRLPFRWERLQQTLNSPLDSTELRRLDDFLSQVASRGMKVLPEPHNYARYNNHLIGTPEVPNSAFADFWHRLAEHLKDQTAVYGYGLVNEPHDTKNLWPAAAQAAVDAIRAVDQTQYIFVPGDNWSGAADWRKHNENLWIDDPANKIVYEAHLYFDADKSGRYTKTYDQEKGSLAIGPDRLKSFRAWLEERNAIGFVGEFGVPANASDDPRWIASLDQFVQHLRQIKMPASYWAGGPWWGEYRLSIEPKNGQDRPQIAALTKGA